MMPELVRWDGFTLHTYGLMWAIGIWLAVWRGLRAAPRYGIRADDVFDLAFVMVVAGIVGARLLYVLTNWSQYAGDWWGVCRVWEGGLSFFGGFATGALAGLWLVRRRRLNAWQVVDLAAPSIALAYAIARIGCFAAGCCYGRPTTLPWGVQFPGLDTPVHPAQLYSTLMNLAIFFALTRVEPRRQFQGQLFALFLILHGIYRFLNEFLRAGATSEPFWGLLTYGHLAAVAVMGAGVYLYHRNKALQGLKHGKT
ncbi:MAG: prolipoprotein diacylglyceryl transferase [Fimbriimonadales bacterium]|nr:prolipoprotein diacylglyceryl transferase [Fimbriimonadales bacterium]